MRRVSPKYGKMVDRHSSERGFSLIELLVVVAILGLIAVIMTIAVSKTLKRQRLDTAAREFQSFLEKGFVTAAQRGTPVFIQIGTAAADGSRTATLYADSNNSGYLETGTDQAVATQIITWDITLVTATTTWPAMGGKYTMECNTRGLAFDPSLPTPAQITVPVIVSLTHKEMVSPATLGPRQRFDISLSPLWRPTITVVRY